MESKSLSPLYLIAVFVHGGGETDTDDNPSLGEKVEKEKGFGEKDGWMDTYTSLISMTGVSSTGVG